MINVELGEEVTFSHFYLDSEDEAYDPADVTFEVVKYASDVLIGPYTYVNEEVERTSAGNYSYTFTVPEETMPGYYTVRWTAEVEGQLQVDYESVLFEEASEEMSGLLAAPRRHGIIRESPLYNTLGVGDTDRLFLIGHADGLTLNSPFQVANIQEAVNVLGADSDSPLLRSLIEAYNCGARDIWLIAAAPMYEYYPDVNDRLVAQDALDGLTFYEKYYERLEETYEMLLDWDYPELIVPIEAPFYDTGDIDFLTQLVFHCALSFEITGTPKLGLIGTRIPEWDTEDLTAMTLDDRLSNLSTYITEYSETHDYHGTTLQNIDGAGKFIMVLFGEGSIMSPQMPVVYTTSIVATAAGTLSSQPVNYGLTYQHLPHVISPIGRALKKEEIDNLTQKKINPLIRTQAGKRGKTFECILATDNTLAGTGSDFWSIVQIRLVSKVIHVLKSLGQRQIGNLGYAQLKQQINDFLLGLVQSNVIRDYGLDITRDSVDINKIIVELSLTPFTGIREVYLVTEIGPGS